MFDQLTPQEVEEITNALAAGNKIEAIKVYRSATGKGLKESKDFIDALLPQLMAQDPERFARAREGQATGCGAKVLLMLSGAGFIVWLVERLA